MAGRCRIATDDRSHHWNSHLDLCRVFNFSDRVGFSNFQIMIVVDALSHNRPPDGFDSPWVSVRRYLILRSSDDVGFSDSQTTSDSQIFNSDRD